MRNSKTFILFFLIISYLCTQICSKTKENEAKNENIYPLRAGWMGT